MKTSELMDYMRKEVMINSSSFRMSDLLIDFVYLTQQLENHNRSNIYWAIRERGTIITQDYEEFEKLYKGFSNHIISTHKIFYFDGGWNIIEINMEEK